MAFIREKKISPTQNQDLEAQEREKTRLSLRQKLCGLFAWRIVPLPSYGGENLPSSRPHILYRDLTVDF